MVDANLVEVARATLLTIWTIERTSFSSNLICHKNVEFESENGRSNYMVMNSRHQFIAWHIQAMTVTLHCCDHHPVHRQQLWISWANFLDNSYLTRIGVHRRQGSTDNRINIHENLIFSSLKRIDLPNIALKTFLQLQRKLLSIS